MKLKDNLKNFAKYVTETFNQFIVKLNEERENFLNEKIEEYDTEFNKYYEEKKEIINNLHKEVNSLEQKIWRTSLNDIVLYKPEKSNIYNNKDERIKYYNINFKSTEDKHIKYGFTSAFYSDGYYPYGVREDNLKVSTNLNKEEKKIPIFHLESLYDDKTLTNKEENKWFQYIDDNDYIVDNTLKQFTRLVPGFANIHSAGFPNANFNYGAEGVSCNCNTINLGYDLKVIINGVVTEKRLYNEFEIIAGRGIYNSLSITSSDPDFFELTSKTNWTEVRNTKNEILHYSKRFSCTGKYDSDIEMSGYVKVFDNTKTYLIIPIKQEAYDSQISFGSIMVDDLLTDSNGNPILDSSGNNIYIKVEKEDLPEGWNRHDVATGTEGEIFSIGYYNESTENNTYSLTLKLSSIDDDEKLDFTYISSSGTSVFASTSEDGKEIYVSIDINDIASSTQKGAIIYVFTKHYNSEENKWIKSKCSCPVYLKIGNFGSIEYKTLSIANSSTLQFTGVYESHFFDGAIYDSLTKQLTIPSKTAPPLYSYGYYLESNKLYIICQEPNSFEGGYIKTFMVEDASGFLNENNIDILGLQNPLKINKLLDYTEPVKDEGIEGGYPKTIEFDSIAISNEFNIGKQKNAIKDRLYNNVEIINITDGVALSKNDEFVTYENDYIQDLDPGEYADYIYANKYKLKFDVNLDNFTEENGKFYDQCHSYVIFNNSTSLSRKDSYSIPFLIPNYEVVFVSVSRSPKSGGITKWNFEEDFEIEIGKNLSKEKSYILEIRAETNSDAGFIGMSSEISNATLLPSGIDKLGVEVLDMNGKQDLSITNRMELECAKTLSTVKYNRFRYYTDKKRKRRVKRTFVYYKVNFNSPSLKFNLTEGKTQQDINYLLVDKIGNENLTNQEAKPLSNYINNNGKLKIKMRISKLSCLLNIQSIVFKLYEKY